jgi:hypothetical protein
VTGKIHILYSHTAAITTGNELPNAASEISSITIDDTAGVTLSKDVVVNDSVVFMQGNLYTPGNFLLSLASGAQLVNESNTGYVVGSASISRTLGYQASAFGNIGAALSAGSDSLGLTAILRKTGPGSALSSNGNSTVNRRWLITSQFPPASGRSLTFHWLSADDNGHLFTPDDPAEVWRLRDTAYESLWNISSVFGMNPRSLTIDGVSELGTFSAALHSTPLKSKRVEIKALIDGFYKGTTMTPDTILVCFTSTTVPYLVIDSVKAFTDSNGLMAISVDAVTNSGSYFVKLKHRNAVETWSAAPVTMVNYELLYDFTASAGQAYGDNLKLVGTKYCLYGGDVNQDGIIDYSDLAETENDSYNFASGYLRTDVTGDQFVDYSDLAIVDNNSFNFIGVITPLNKKAVTVRKLAPHPARKEIQSPPGVL